MDRDWNREPSSYTNLITSTAILQATESDRNEPQVTS